MCLCCGTCEPKALQVLLFALVCLALKALSDFSLGEPFRDVPNETPQPAPATNVGIVVLYMLLITHITCQNLGSDAFFLNIEPDESEGYGAVCVSPVGTGCLRLCTLVTRLFLNYECADRFRLCRTTREILQSSTCVEWMEAQSASPKTAITEQGRCASFLRQGLGVRGSQRSSPRL